MSVKKFNSFKSKNPEAVNDLIQLLNEESVHVELFDRVINGFTPLHATKMRKAFDLLNAAGMINVIEKEFTYKKICQQTSMLVSTTEIRKYYVLEESQ